MKIYKNAFSYITWFLFLIVTFFTLLVTSEGITTKYNKSDDILFMGIVFFAVIIVACLVLGFNYLLNKIFANRNPFSKDATPYVSGVILFFIVVLGFMTRFIYLVMNDISLSGTTTLYYYTLGGYYDLALEQSPLNALYSRILQILFSLFGEQITTAVYFNIILDVCAVVITFFIVRKLTNNIYGMFSALIVSFLPYNIHEILAVSAGKLYVLIISSALLTMIYGVSKLLSPSENKGNAYVVLTVSGLLSGLAYVCDVASFSLLIAFICLNLGVAINSEEKTVNKLYGYVAYIISSIISFVAFSYILILGTGFSLKDFIVDIYVFGLKNVAFNMYVTSPAYGTYGSILLVGLSILWLIRFFMIKDDICSFIIIISATCGLLSLLGLERASYNMIITYLWCVSAVFGVYTFSTKAVSNAKDNRNSNLSQEGEVFKKKNDSIKLYGNSANHSTKSDDALQRAKELEASLDFLKKAHEPNSNNKSDIINTVSNDNISPEEAKQLAENSAEMTARINQANKPLNRSFRSMNYKTAVVNKYNEAPEKEKAPVSANLDEVVTVAGHTVTKGELYSTMFGTNSSDEKANSNEDVKANSDNVQNVPIMPASEENVTKVDVTEDLKTIENNKSTIANNQVSDDVPRQPSMSTRYGRRMDYKTAVVVSNNNLDLTQKINSDEKLEKTNNPELSNDKNEDSSNINRNQIVAEIAVEKINETNEIDNKAKNVNDKHNASSLNDHDKQLQDVSDTNNESDTKTVNDSENKLDTTTNPEKDKMSNSDTEKKVTLIHNPLPTPKKHVAKELDFDIEPQVSDMHFDIVNLTGKDFFDIN